MIVGQMSLIYRLRAAATLLLALCLCTTATAANNVKCDKQMAESADQPGETLLPVRRVDHQPNVTALESVDSFDLEDTPISQADSAVSLDTQVEVLLEEVFSSEPDQAADQLNPRSPLAGGSAADEEQQDIGTDAAWELSRIQRQMLRSDI